MKVRKKRPPGRRPPLPPTTASTAHWGDTEDRNRRPPGRTDPGISEFRARAAELGVTFHDVATPHLVTIEADPGIRARDAFVKIAPRLPASARETFDGAAASAAARAAGALGVVLAPVWLRELTRAESDPDHRRMTAREAVKRWFDQQKAMDAGDREAAEGAVLRFIDLEGM